MKLYLTDQQRMYLTEILKASQQNAIDGKDAELAQAFEGIVEKVQAENVSYVNLKRGEAETIVEFCEIVRQSLDKALAHLEGSEKSEEEKEDLREKVTKARDDMHDVSTQLQNKINQNPE